MNLDSHSSATSSERPTLAPRLSLGRAFIALGAAFLSAQLLGKLVGDVASSVSHTRSGGLSSGVVIPSMLGSELALLAVALCTPLLSALPLREALGLRAARLRVFAAATVGTVMLGPLGDWLMTQFVAHFPKLTLGVIPALHDLARSLPLVWLWPTFALLPGLSEELLFRGVLQRAAGNSVFAIWLSGCAFALFHVDPVHVVGVLPLGLFLAWVARRSGTLVSIVAHVLNNSVALLTIKSSSLDVGFGSEQPLPWSWLCGSLVLVGIAIAALARATPQPQPAP